MVITNKEKADLLKILKNFVDLHGKPELFSNKFYGEVHRNHFSIYKSSIFFNTTLVKINGKFFSDEKGNTIIKMAFLLSEHVLLFFVLSLICFLTVFIIGLYNVEEFWWKMIPLILFVLDYLLISICFYYIGNNAKFHLIDKLRGKELT